MKNVVNHMLCLRVYDARTSLFVAIDRAFRRAKSICPGSKGLSICLALLLVMSGGCNSRRYTTKEMSWSIEPGSYPFRPLPPGAIRLTFLDAPQVHTVVTDVRTILLNLQKTGRSVVLVGLEVQ